MRLLGCGQNLMVEHNIVVDTIDTGSGFHYLTGVPNDWLPTGTSFSLSMQDGGHNFYDNWTYHTDPKINENILRHIHVLCDYG